MDVLKPPEKGEKHTMKRYLMRWLLGFTLLFTGSAWMAAMAASYTAGRDGDGVVIFSLAVQLIGLVLCLHAAIAGELAAARERKKALEREDAGGQDLT